MPLTVWKARQSLSMWQFLNWCWDLSFPIASIAQRPYCPSTKYRAPAGMSGKENTKCDCWKKMVGLTVGKSSPITDVVVRQNPHKIPLVCPSVFPKLSPACPQPLILTIHKQWNKRRLIMKSTPFFHYLGESQKISTWAEDPQHNEGTVKYGDMIQRVDPCSSRLPRKPPSATIV